ncbi:MAG: 4Fe-4S binding protein [Dethiobacter sp.]|jgi:Fe-S-cluster-containing hydrogenase component 2|nr:4Fe-4S binding protein [Dethiobacter sp.]
MNMKHLFLIRDKCTGCRTCEYSCSLHHYNVFNPSRSRIQIYRTGCLDLEAKYCVQCVKPRCVPACPEKAIKQGENGVRIESKLCNHCGQCMKVCDRIFSDGCFAIMCNNCGACVDVCPEEALEIRVRKKI